MSMTLPQTALYAVTDQAATLRGILQQEGLYE